MLAPDNECYSHSPLEHFPAGTGYSPVVTYTLKNRYAPGASNLRGRFDIVTRCIRGRQSTKVHEQQVLIVTEQPGILPQGGR